MKVLTSIVLQGLLVALALVVTLMRCWVRLRLEHRKLSLPDYLVWGAWLCSLGWFICSAIALHILINRPLVDQISDSVAYLVTVFIGSYFFDIGLYFPKASILSFYWWLIPIGFRRLRVALYVGTIYTACAFLSSFLMDTLIANPISNNWSLTGQEYSLWNSLTALIVNWCLNWSTDLLVFILPFFIINCLQLRKRQKIALCGVFSLGLITIITSLTRFIVFMQSTSNLDDASGNLWYTAEMCTATIVVSLPALKPLIMRVTPTNTSNRGTSAYVKSGPQKSFDPGRGHRATSRAHVEAGRFGDDEIELVLQDSRKSSLSRTTHTTSEAGAHDSKDAVKVTTDVTVVREAI